MTKLRSRMDYKWVILVVCFLMEFLCLGFCSSNVGLYTRAVTAALNINRSTYSLSTSIRYATQVITALYFGTVLNKLGIKKTVFLGLTLMTGSVLTRALATEFYHLYIGGALWGGGMVFVGNTMAGTIIRRWFHEDVGKYTGVVMSANGIGGAVAAQVITPLINNGELYGYRKAYFLSAAIALVVSIIVIIFLRENPKGGPAIQADGGKKKPRGVLWPGLEYAQVKKRPYFYLTAVLVFLTGVSLQSVGNVTIVYLSDIGLSPGFVATVATVSSLSLAFAKIVVGTTYDKKGLRFAFLMCQIGALCSFVIYAFLTNSVSGMVFAILATVLSSLATPMETVMITLLANDMFGARAYGKVLGVLYAMNSLGLCLGSPLGDLYYDLFGTYKPCFWFFSVILILVALGYRFAIRAAYKDKQAVLAECENNSNAAVVDG